MKSPIVISRTIKKFRESIFIGLQNRKSLQEKQTNAVKQAINADQSNTLKNKKTIGSFQSLQLVMHQKEE
jgi:hypothetical protein